MKNRAGINWAGVVLSVVVVGMWGVWGGVMAAGAAEGDAAKGRPIYEKYCLLCHGPQGLGDGPQGQLMKPPATNLRSPQSKSKPDATLLKTIKDGHPNSAMTKWAGTLSDEEMRNVLAYIRQLSGGPDKGM